MSEEVRAEDIRDAGDSNIDGTSGIRTVLMTKNKKQGNNNVRPVDFTLLISEWGVIIHTSSALIDIVSLLKWRVSLGDNDVKGDDDIKMKIQSQKLFT